MYTALLPRPSMVVRRSGNVEPPSVEMNNPLVPLLTAAKTVEPSTDMDLIDGLKPKPDVV